MKSEVKLNSNLRRLHSVTETDKGKDKNKRNFPPLCWHSACVQRCLLRSLTVGEPRSHCTGNVQNGVESCSSWKTHQMARRLSPRPRTRDYLCGRSLTSRAQQPLLELLLTIEATDTAPLSAPGLLTANGTAFLFDRPTSDTAEFDLRDTLLFLSSSPPKAHKLHNSAEQS